MAVLNYVKTIKSKIGTVPVKDGQVIFLTDTGELLVDDGSKRVESSDVVTLGTTGELNSLIAPLDKFYYVRDTKKLYRYDFVHQKWDDLFESVDKVGENIPPDPLEALLDGATVDNSLTQWMDGVF